MEISPSGFGLHFPNSDAGLCLPALLEGFLGSRKSMASRLGPRGESSTSKRKRVRQQRAGDSAAGLRRRLPQSREHDSPAPANSGSKPIETDPDYYRFSINNP
jgi:hypothetical protein